MKDNGTKSSGRHWTIYLHIAGDLQVAFVNFGRSNPAIYVVCRTQSLDVSLVDLVTGVPTKWSQRPRCSDHQ
jgi:hypothetical protein